MIRFFCIIIVFSSLIVSKDYEFSSPYLKDSTLNNTDQLLNYDSISKVIKNNYDKAIFFQAVSYHIYKNTLNIEQETIKLVDNYSNLINDLENRLGIQPTKISYNLGSPGYKTHFIFKTINRKLIKSNFYLTHVENLKNQYLSFLRYRSELINLCESRISELINELDNSSIDKIYGDLGLDKQIILMNFTNISNFEKYDNFSNIFPEIIMNRYKNRDDIYVDYSGKISPDTNTLSINNLNKFLLDGSFNIKGNTIMINYKLYSISDWSLLINKSQECDIRDTNCIYDTFLWNLEQSINPLLKGVPYNDFSNEDKTVIIKKNKTDNKDELFNKILDDFVVQKDYDFNIDFKGMDIGDNSQFNTKEFDFKNHPKSVSSRTEKTNKLLQIFSDFMLNPYNINIGNIEMNVNKSDNAYVDLNVPVSYSVKENDFKKSLKNFKYNNQKNKPNINIYEFLYENYRFQDIQLQDLYSNSSEVFPVLFFTDVNGNIQKIIIDSWDTRYENLYFGDYDVSRYEIFNQLFSVIESNNGFLFHLKNKEFNTNYKLTMPISVLDNYTKLTIKLFSRKELDKYLPITELKF
tara:strand:- start:5542 stop:7275 length:1734 start_codon:yes stop_codon:yes gene_type:complete